MKLKSWLHFFQAIVAGQKKHDLRTKADRNFKVGDIVTLCEYNNITGGYTGREIDVKITYITDDVTPCAFSSVALAKPFCILSLEPVSEMRIVEPESDTNEAA